MRNSEFMFTATVAICISYRLIMNWDEEHLEILAAAAGSLIPRRNLKPFISSIFAKDTPVISESIRAGACLHPAHVLKGLGGHLLSCTRCSCLMLSPGSTFWPNGLILHTLDDARQDTADGK